MEQSVLAVRKQSSTTRCPHTHPNFRTTRALPFFRRHHHTITAATSSLTMASAGLVFSSHAFGDHERQEVAVWEWKEAKSDGYWLIYIHGGFWWFPHQSFGDFTASMKHMTAPGYPARSSIRGFISLDYRITNPEESGSVKYPEPLNDVVAGLSMVADKVGLTNDNYILIGQSAGAALAFQLLMGMASEAIPRPPLPTAIIGVSGLYDLVRLNDHAKGEYAKYITAAFGPNQRDWQNASPAKYKGQYRKQWPGDRWVVLAHSTEDQYLDVGEMDSMLARLKMEDIPVHDVRNLTGKHDFVWEEGSQIAQLVAELLPKLPKV